jgi:hypothetical protein
LSLRVTIPKRVSQGNTAIKLDPGRREAIANPNASAEQQTVEAFCCANGDGGDLIASNPAKYKSTHKILLIRD